MSKNKYLFQLIILFASGLLFTNYANAQTYQQEINRSNDIIHDVNDYLDSIQPEIDTGRSHENQLYQSCMDGNNNACQKYKELMQRKTEWLKENDCRFRTGLNRC